jgi:hypothetical protein
VSRRISIKARILGAAFVLFLLWRAVDAAAFVVREIRNRPAILTRVTADSSVEERVLNSFGDNATAFQLLDEHVAPPAFVYVAAAEKRRPAVLWQSLGGILYPLCIRPARGLSPEWTPHEDAAESEVYLLDCESGVDFPWQSRCTLVDRAGEDRLWRLERDRP